MRYFCAHCLKPFEAKRQQEFCTPECLHAFHSADKQHERAVREALRERPVNLPGSRIVAGGRQAINFGLSDEA